MFSGIITNIEKPKSVKKNTTSVEVALSIPKDWKLTLGESVNINGVCSTVKALDKTTFSVFYMPETLDKTNMGEVDKDSVLNLERCLTLNDLIGGHLVYGHVDTTAKVSGIKTSKDSSVVTFKLLSSFTKYIVYKGSIAVNGVSLTVVDVTKTSFTVSLIPHTLTHTNLGNLSIGDIVNIEVDMMAKHLEKLISGNRS